LPGRDGIEVLRALRARGIQAPVLMLTARDSLSDRLAGLDAGADDYLVKPFAFPELVARLRALGRRGTSADLRLRLADLEVDLVARRAVRGGQEIKLTPREFEFLAYLVRHAGRVVSREMLARDVWQEFGRGTPLDNVIDVHVVRLRRKIDQGFSTRLIHTIRGLGFVAKEPTA
jgi:DNA-binding response OmpR family regulator